MNIRHLFGLFHFIIFGLFSPAAESAFFGPDAYLLVNDLRGLQKSASLEWKGAKIGKATVVGMENGQHRLDLSIQSDYFSNLHADVRFVLDGEAGKITLIGGDKHGSPNILKGDQIFEAQNLATQGTQVVKDILRNALDGVKGFTKGVARDSDSSSPEDNKRFDSNKNTSRSLDWLRGRPDLILRGNLEETSSGTPVKWQGGIIGKIVKITNFGAEEQAEVQLSSGYQGQLRSDARFAIEKGMPVTVNIIGGVDPAAVALEKGATIRQQSAEDLGSKAGVLVRGLIKQGVEASRDAVKTIQEEVKKQSPQP